MTNSIVNPLGEPKPTTGDLNRVTYTPDFYAEEEAVYEQRLLTQQIEAQSRLGGSLVFYEPNGIRHANYERRYNLRFSFHNYTPSDIVVVDRMGLPVTIPPHRLTSENPKYRGTFLIRKELYFDNQDVAHQAYRNVLSLGKLQGKELSEILPYLGAPSKWGFYGRCLAIEYCLTADDIRAGDGRLYHLPSDIVVSFLSAANTIRHPCSPEYVQDLNNAYLPNYSVGLKDIRMVYRYINADVKAPPKYLRLGKFIFMLEPETGEPARLGLEPRGKDKALTEVELTEYIEVIYPAHLDATRKDVKGWRCHRMTMEQARESGEIFDTQEDARNPIQAAERERQKHKDDLAAQAAKHADTVRNLEAKINSKEEDEQRHKRTIEELRRARDLELERIREANERATHRRRLSSENIKLLATLATAGVTIGSLYLKYLSTQAASS